MRDFKDFVLRGNVMDLAVAVVIGAAFGTVVASFVANILTPLLSIPGSADFSSYSFTIGGSTFSYGLFLNALLSFLLIAAAVFFFVVKPVNALMARRKTQPDLDTPTKQCTECMSSIPAPAKRCAFCTSPQ